MDVTVGPYHGVDDGTNTTASIIHGFFRRLSLPSLSATDVRRLLNFRLSCSICTWLPHHASYILPLVPPSSTMLISPFTLICSLLFCRATLCWRSICKAM